VLAALAFRALQGLSGFIAYYGATGMLTSQGLRPPNVLVLMGLAAIGLTTIAASRAERRPARRTVGRRDRRRAPVPRLVDRACLRRAMSA